MSPTRAQPRGFTLLELLASIFISSIVLLTAASLLGSSGDSYERVGGGVTSEREARALMAQLTADLATAQFHPDIVIETQDGKWPSSRLGILTLQAADAQSREKQIGDLCAVHYYLANLTIGDKTVRCLMRGFHNSADVFAALRENRLPSLFEPDEQLDEPIAFNVAGFELRPLLQSPTGELTPWPPASENAPQQIDIRLDLVRRDLANRLRSPANWTGEGASGRQLGSISDADKNRFIDTYRTSIRFGNDSAR